MGLKRIPTEGEVLDLLQFIELLKTWQSDNDYAEMETSDPVVVAQGEKLLAELAD
jgi:hypothetical protein